MPPFAYRSHRGYSRTRGIPDPPKRALHRPHLPDGDRQRPGGGVPGGFDHIAVRRNGGQPQSIFITVPPEKLTSHRCLLRLWVGVLLTTVMRRKRIPKQRTLFVLDEAAQLGTFDPLWRDDPARGFGLQLVMVWQDLAQIKSRYPADWATIVNNSAALLAFGFGHYHAAKEYADILGLDPGLNWRR